MKTIDFDAKILSLKETLVKNVPKAAMPVTTTVVDKTRLAYVIKVISAELLKDPVIVSLMSLRNDPTPQSVESFLETVKDKIDYATKQRYKEMLDGVFVKEKKNDQTV